MVKTFVAALILGVFVLTVWQSGTRISSAEVHTGDLHNCEDFLTQAEAQAHLRENPTDPDRLDADNDGVACDPPQLPCPCDLVPVIDPGSGSSSPTPTPTRTPTASGSAGSGALCHDNCIPDEYAADGLNSSPGFNRPVAMSFLPEKTTIGCGAQTSLVVRLVYPDGIGAPNRLVTFRSSLGTVQSNRLTDYAGYVQTTFVAPPSPAIVQIDAFADGLRQTLQVKVDCLQPQAGVPYSPPIAPPRTGDAGLAMPRP